MSSRRTKLAAIASAIVAGGALTASLAAMPAHAATASPAIAAAPPTTITAVTNIINRPDNGGGGVWANDSFTRTLTLTYLGKVTPADVTANPSLAPDLGLFIYDAHVSDTGRFWDYPGALTPDQGGQFFGRHLRFLQVQGTFSGTGDWGVFFANHHAQAGLVPSSIVGHVANALYPSNTWPENAFPTGTTFASFGGEVQFNYQYKANATHNGLPELQTWSDSNLNLDGQLPADGNIFGSN